jgi:hypothetical protein
MMIIERGKEPSERRVKSIKKIGADRKEKADWVMWRMKSKLESRNSFWLVKRLLEKNDLKKSFYLNDLSSFYSFFSSYFYIVQ